MNGSRRRSTKRRPANTEIVRSGYGLAFVSCLDPQVVFEPDRSEPGAKPVRGRDRVAGLLESAREAWESCRFELDDVRELDEERVLVCGTVRARARGTGAPLELSFANLWTLREGKAVRIAAFGDRAEALGALNGA